MFALASACKAYSNIFFVKYYSFGLNLFLVTWAGSKKLGFVRVSLFCLGKFSSGDPVGEEGSTGIDH